MSVPAADQAPSRWRIRRAYAWFLWGQSLAYWGTRLSEERFYRWALGAYSRAIAIWPGFAQAYCRRGIIRGRELDDYSGAIRDLNAAIELKPDWPEPYLQRGLFHRFHGPAAAARAVADLQRFLELEPSSTWREEAERQIATLQSEIAEHRARTGGQAP